VKIIIWIRTPISHQPLKTLEYLDFITSTTPLIPSILPSFIHRHRGGSAIFRGYRGRSKGRNRWGISAGKGSGTGDSEVGDGSGLGLDKHLFVHNRNFPSPLTKIINKFDSFNLVTQ